MDLNMISKDFPNIFLTQIWPKLSLNLGKKKIWSWSCKAINLVAYFRWKPSARYPEKELMTKSDGKQYTGMQKRKGWLCKDCLCWKKSAFINHLCAYICMGNIQSHFLLLLFTFLHVWLLEDACECDVCMCVFMWVYVSMRCMLCMWVYIHICTTACDEQRTI